MKVKRLKMTSFRGIGDLTLEFDAGEPTIIIGINGAGKSSILDCLAILLSRLTGQIQTTSGSGRFFSDRDVSNGCNETHNTITILRDSQEVTWSLTHVLKRSFVDELQYRQLKADLAASNPPELQALIDELYRQLEESPQANLPLIVYYPVNRTVLDVPLEIYEEYGVDRIDAYEQALRGGQINFKSFFQWIRNREDLEN